MKHLALNSPTGRQLLVASALFAGACSSTDRPTGPATGPDFAISDAVHEGGTPGFFFLPPMAAQPSFSGTFDADIATLSPQIAICNVAAVDCSGPSAIVVFTTATAPAITVDPTGPQYQVNWDTQGPGFLAGHTYRLHVTAGATGARRELGFADVLLTTAPGQAKSLQTGDIIVLQDGRTLPIHLRVETGIPGSIAVSAATASVTTGGTDLMTATVHDLHGALLAGASVAWSLMTTPPTGVADATQPLNPTSGLTGTAGTTATTFKAGAASGMAVVRATSTGLSATVSVTVATPVTGPSSTGDMNFARRDHTSTALDDGRVLIVGGTATAAELYDPATGVFTTLQTAYPRTQGTTATKLADGRVLVVGGLATPTRAELFDPGTNTFRAIVGTTNGSRAYHSATRLADGRVLLAGGQDNPGSVSHALAEIFDPAAGTFTVVGSLHDARAAHAAALLASGRVLIVGGNQTTGASLSSAELFDPSTETFSFTGSTTEPRGSISFTGITRLNDGKVLVLSGLSSTTTAELYDPATGTFGQTGNMNHVHITASVTLLSDGRVLVTGGWSFGKTGPQPSAEVEIYEPTTGTFAVAPQLLSARFQFATSRLLDGRVLVTGGFNNLINSDLKAAELYSIAPIP